jgi:hypothetical protein
MQSIWDRIPAIGVLIGLVASIGGGLMWIGTERGRMDDQDRRLSRVETRVDAIEPVLIRVDARTAFLYDRAQETRRD